MIKNDIQLNHIRARIEQLLGEVADINQEYSDAEKGFFAGALNEEVNELQKQVDEYLYLRESPLDIAIETLSQHPILLENIGELLTKLRIAAKLTQPQLAKRLGWHQSNLSRFESDNYSSQTIAKVSQYTGALGFWLHVVPSLTEKPVEITYENYPKNIGVFTSASVTSDSVDVITLPWQTQKVFGQVMFGQVGDIQQLGYNLKTTVGYAQIKTGEASWLTSLPNLVQRHHQPQPMKNTISVSPDHNQVGVQIDYGNQK